MPRAWLMGISLACGMGCAVEQGAGTAAVSSAALAACAYPVVQLAAKGGPAQQTVSPAMTLPIPGTIPIESGTGDLRATLTYTLSADEGRPLACRYRRSGSRLSLSSCERNLDATSFIEASSVKLTLSDRRAAARLLLCPDGPAVDIAATPVAANVNSVRSDQLRGQAVAAEPDPDGRTAQDVEAYVAAARQESTVQMLLGERSAFIQELAVSTAKRAPRNHHHLRLIFFSHTYNRAVEVVVDHRQVEAAQYISYWPPEGKEEIDEAIALATADPRLTVEVPSLRAGGMLWQPTADVPYIQHRVMDIRFYDHDLIARYFATVDLTDEVVQAAGAVQ